MSGFASLLARALLGVIGAAAMLLLSRYRPAYRWSDSRFRITYLAMFAGVRVLLFVVVFLVLRIAPRGDLPGVYVSEIQSALSGRIPYRDYPSSYAPLFPYVFAPVWHFFPTPLALILLSIAVEVAMAAVFVRLLPRLVSRETARLTALLCLANPISLQFVSIDGQNNVLIGLALGVALWLLLERRQALSGAVVGFAIASVKFLPLLFAPAFLAASRRRALAWLGGCGLISVSIYAYFAMVLHAPVLQALAREVELKSASGLPFLLETITGIDFGRLLWDVLQGFAVAAVALMGWRALRRAGEVSRNLAAAATVLLPALLLTVMVMGKKTWPTYSEMVLFPMALGVASCSREGRPGERRFSVPLFCAFGLLSVTVHSVWATLLRPAPAVHIHYLLRFGIRTAWCFLLLEAAMVVAYFGMIAVCLRQVRWLAGQRA